MSATAESWNARSAFAALRASARHTAGLENARKLIGQARGVRYLRYLQVDAAAQREKAREAKQIQEGIKA